MRREMTIKIITIKWFAALLSIRGGETKVDKLKKFIFSDRFKK